MLNAAGTSTTTVGSDALAQAGVVYDGLKSLGGGAILAGMVLGAIAAFMIDERYETALVAGDVATLNKLFWDSSLTLRFGIADRQRGATEITTGGDGTAGCRPGGSCTTPTYSP